MQLFLLCNMYIKLLVVACLLLGFVGTCGRTSFEGKAVLLEGDINKRNITDNIMSNSSRTLHPFVNAQHNSQSTFELPTGRWEIAWSSVINDVIEYDFILQSKSRILIQGFRRWQLFSDRGELLARDDHGASDIFIDPANQLFFMADRFGRLTSFNISSGAVDFVTVLEGNSEYLRTFVTRRDNLVLATSYYQILNPHAPRPIPAYSVAEIIDLGDENHREEHMLLAANQIHRYEFESNNILGATLGDLVIITVDNQLLIGDFALEWNTVFEDEFEPLELSLDDAGNIYMIVKQKERRVFWQFSMKGKKQKEIELPVALDAEYVPPIIGPDGSVYIIVENQLLVYPVEGESWDYSFDRPIAGAIVSVNNKLILTVGSYLLSFDPDGTRNALMMLPTGRWTSPPALTEKGDILILSQDHLYCLKIKEE